MAWPRLRSLLAGLLRRRTVEHDMDAEIRSHIEARVDDLVGRGLDRVAAARQARLEFGSVERYREEIRAARGLQYVDEVRADLLCGLRGLRRAPGFAIAATLSLAVGIGVNTLVFSVLDAALLRPLNVPEPDRLVTIWNIPDATRPEQIGTSSIPRYFAIRDLAKSFESVAAYNGVACGVKTLGSGENGAPPERILGQTVSPSMFRTLAVPPMLGRTFAEDEDRVDQVAAVMVLSYRTWQRRFGGDPTVVGKTVSLDGQPTTVIGVMPEHFDLLGDDTEFFLPLCLTRAQVESRVGGNTIIARLKSGLSLEAAQDEIDAIGARLAASDPQRHRGIASRVEPLQRAHTRAIGGTMGQPFVDYAPVLLMLQGAVGFVLLIACANVAGLLLARAAVRRREIALRHAIGATSRRITRQLVTEAVPLAVIGGALGLLLARGGLALFIATAPPGFPRLDELRIDSRALAFTAATVVATAFLFAILPALQAARARGARRLGDADRTVTDGPMAQRSRSLLVMGQIALSLVLLVGAGLMIRSFAHALVNDLGADTSGVLTFEFRLAPRESYKQIGMYRGSGLFAISPVPAERFERVLDELQAMPGVTAVAGISSPPFGGTALAMPFRVDGRADAPATLDESGRPVLPTVEYRATTRGYFDAMKIPVRAGREFERGDTAASLYVAVINEAMARQHFPGQDPVGQYLRFDFLPDEPARQIVGVVGDTLTDSLQTRPVATVYVPHQQQTAQFVGPFVYSRIGMHFVVRTSGDPLALVPAVKRAVARIDPTTPVAAARTVEQALRDQVRNLRLYAMLLAVFGGAAVLLAVTGLYGVIAQAVADRKREIGIRMALGACVQDVMAMVGGYATRIIAPGLVIGLLGALALVRGLRSTLFNVTPTDPVTYAVVTLLLVVVAAIACLVPARRAAIVSPMVALKQD